VVLLILSIFVFAISLYRNLTLENFVSTVVAPLTPAFLWGTREIRKHREAAESLNRLKSYIEQTWTRALGGELTASDLTQESIQIQNEIFDLRSRNPLIYNWIHRKVREAQQKNMLKKAEELAHEALSRLSQ
jgi:hypothetical protein